VSRAAGRNGPVGGGEGDRAATRFEGSRGAGEVRRTPRAPRSLTSGGQRGGTPAAGPGAACKAETVDKGAGDG
jgi:hypothetical protein